MARLTLDANVLVYAADRLDRRCTAAREIIRRAALSDCILTVQAMGEFFAVVIRKRIIARLDAMTLFEEWSALFGEPMAHKAENLMTAMDGTLLNRFQFWDAMLLATADAAGCTALISEDMAHGATLGRVQVVRAFDGDAVSPEALAVLA